jgi:hypothetical protein
MSPANQPYLSVVVTTRNDDHGGSLLRRTQTFVNALIGQCKRHGLSAELIFVEWNPPADRPPLREALRWPRDLGPCQVRLIEAPASIHARYRNAQALPLYQMIAKNVGIRRARGRFALATNIDILFSDELMAFLAGRQLEVGRMYRMDRHDVAADVPVDAAVEEQLAYCESHLIRVHAREGVFPLTPEGTRAPAAKDIARAGAGIAFGKGWFSPELKGSRPFRWVDNDAYLTVFPPSDPCPPLLFEMEPGPSMPGWSFDLAFLDGDGAILTETRVTGHSHVKLHLPPGNGPRLLRLHTAQGGLPVRHDPRLLGFRVFRCDWGDWALEDAPHSRSREAGGAADIGYRSESNPVSVLARARNLVSKIAGILHRAAENGPFVPVWVPVPWPVRAFLRFCLRVQEPPPPQPPAAVEPVEVVPGLCSQPVYLHTDACGDFTLMATQHWFDLRGYPEWDLYSFHTDSVLCYAAHHGGAREVVLKEPMRIYHIEHGSGWTPEGEKQLFDRLREQGVPWLAYEDLVSLAVQMRRLDSPMIFNHETWGLSGLELPETAL